MLACTRMGAVHSVVFGGLSAESLKERINDAKATVLVTADGGFRRGAEVPLKKFADEALRGTPSVRHVVVVRRGNFPVQMTEGRDRFWHDLMRDRSAECPPEPMDSEDMLYILYTSGTTGKPKGIVHATGGYMVGVHTTTRLVFDLKPEDVYWCTADIGWQTETGMIMIPPLPGITVTKPGSATRPFPGVSAEVLDENGRVVKEGGGYLAITSPWPAMLQTIYGDPDRYVKQYWSKWDTKTYFPGDGAKRDRQGYFWLLGRVDDVLNVAGHRIGTMEVESALVYHPAVAEAAVVGKTHDLKGQALAAFVTLKEGIAADGGLVAELKAHVVHRIAALARPGAIVFAADLPKTRPGKIMRRLLKDIAEGRALGDVLE